MPKIQIVEPQPTWSDEYAQIEQELNNALGFYAISIDHIGSTSVPELPAKDVIDIQITVHDLSKPDIVNRLVDAGFNYRSGINNDNLVGYEENSDDLKKLFFTEKSHSRRCHIHIRELGNENQRYPLLFRDFLIADKMVRQAYAILKKELAAKFPNDSGAYYAIKDPYMDTVYRAACLWAEKAG